MSVDYSLEFQVSGDLSDVEISRMLWNNIVPAPILNDAMQSTDPLVFCTPAVRELGVSSPASGGGNVQLPNEGVFVFNCLAIAGPISPSEIAELSDGRVTEKAASRAIVVMGHKLLRLIDESVVVADSGGNIGDLHVGHSLLGLKMVDSPFRTSHYDRYPSDFAAQVGRLLGRDVDQDVDHCDVAVDAGSEAEPASDITSIEVITISHPEPAAATNIEQVVDDPEGAPVDGPADEPDKTAVPVDLSKPAITDAPKTPDADTLAVEGPPLHLAQGINVLTDTLVITRHEIREPYVYVEPTDEELKELEEAWQMRGLCAQTDPEAFFPEKGGSTREAKRICSGCEVKAECLDHALENNEAFGIWGGLSERERRRLRRGERTPR